METPAVSCEKEIPYCAICSQVMLTAFWDCRGPLVLDFMPRGSTINADRFCFTLSLLRAAIRKKRRRILDVNNVIIHHDNARPHVADKTVNKLRKFHWECLEHAPYRPDLAPSDFHLFSPLKKFLAGQRFTSDDEVKAAVRQWFRSQTADFYCSGIAKLVLRWDKCLNGHVDYVEKWWKVQGITSTCLVRCMYLILPVIKYGQRLFDLHFPGGLVLKNWKWQILNCEKTVKVASSLMALVLWFTIFWLVRNFESGVSPGSLFLKKTLSLFLKYT